MGDLRRKTASNVSRDDVRKGKDGVLRPRPWREGIRAVAGDAVRRGHRAGDGDTVCGERKAVERVRHIAIREFRCDRPSAQPDRVISSAPGTNGGVFAVESDEDDDGCNEQE
jgi:hypothetical protein